MTPSKAKDNLRSFFSQLREIDAKRQSGELDHLHHTLKVNHAKDLLAETNWRGHYARQIALQIATSKVGLSAQDRATLERLREQDIKGYQAWVEAGVALNLERLSLAILDLMESLDHPPVPAPSPVRASRG